MYNQQPGFYELSCIIILVGLSVGFFLITPARTFVSGNQHGTIDAPRATEDAVSLVNAGLLTADSGVVLDPHDKNFRISWTVTGRSVPVQEIFSAAVHGIATAAQHDTNGPYSYTTGVSFSGNAAFHIGGYLDEDLPCGMIAKAFVILAEFVVKKERKFHEMEFTLTLDGKMIGEGYIFKVSSLESHGGNDTDRTATS